MRADATASMQPTIRFARLASGAYSLPPTMTSRRAQELAFRASGLAGEALLWRHDKLGQGNHAEAELTGTKPTWCEVRSEGFLPEPTKEPSINASAGRCRWD